MSLFCDCGLATLFVVISESALVSPTSRCEVQYLCPCSAAAMSAVMRSISSTGLLYVIHVSVSTFYNWKGYF